MITEERINPFIVTPPNQCLVCGAELVLVTAEYTIQTLHEDGRPGNFVIGKYEQTMRCPACNMKYHAEEDRKNGTFTPIFMNQKRIPRPYCCQDDDVKDDFVRNH